MNMIRVWIKVEYHILICKIVCFNNQRSHSDQIGGHQTMSTQMYSSFILILYQVELLSWQVVAHLMMPLLQSQLKYGLDEWSRHMLHMSWLLTTVACYKACYK